MFNRKYIAGTGIENEDIYPSPAESVLNVKAGNEDYYRIVDITGKEMMSGIVSGGQIQVGNLNSGVYFVQLGGRYTKIFKK